MHLYIYICPCRVIVKQDIEKNILITYIYNYIYTHITLN